LAVQFEGDGEGFAFGNGVVIGGEKFGDAAGVWKDGDGEIGCFFGVAIEPEEWRDEGKVLKAHGIHLRGKIGQTVVGCRSLPRCWRYVRGPEPEMSIGCAWMYVPRNQPEACLIRSGRIGIPHGNVRAMTGGKWRGFEQKQTATVLTGELNRGMCYSPLVTSGLCFYNPHITAWKAGQSNGDPGIQPPGEPWQFLANRPRARVYEFAAIFLISQEH